MMIGKSEKRIVTKFSLFKSDQGMYILPATAIMNPMIVVPDWESTHSTSMLAVLPQRKWGGVFSRFIKKVDKGMSLDGTGNSPRDNVDTEDEEEEDDDDQVDVKDDSDGQKEDEDEGVDDDSLVPEFNNESDSDIEVGNVAVDVETDEEGPWEGYDNELEGHLV